MKKMLIAVIVATFALPVFSSDNDAKTQEYLELCKLYAKDDGVSADEMDEYLKSCVKDLQESAKD